MTTPATAWTATGPAESGFAADVADRIDFGVRAGLISGLHSVVVTRHGQLAFERYYSGDDYSWATPLGEVAHGPNTLHDLRSVTKSVVSLLYGIALARGQVAPPDAPLLQQFPQYPDLAVDPARSKITIAHALTMSMGTAWDESLPYTDPANSEIAMEHAPDRLRFVLDRPLMQEPGAGWIYSGGASALIGAMIAQGTGQPLDVFAREALLSPLGIEHFEWARGSDGVLSAASGLRLSARDLARIGHLLLAGGEIGGKQIVPEEWLTQSTRVHLPTTDGLGYGYQWWLGTAPVRELNWQEQPWIGGFGNGGQRLLVMPAVGVTMVAFFGNYNQPMSWKYPARLWWEIVLPGLEMV
jgi:CubicO group peptidase (beta-lactamase class C family)